MVNPDERHITYYRHGEVALLLEPIDKERVLHDGTIVDGPPDKQPPLDAETLAALRERFQACGVPLLTDDAAAVSDPAITGADGRVRSVLPMRRGELCVLQTVNLQSWIAEPMKEKRLKRLRASIDDVATAVNRLNEYIHQHRDAKFGRYRLRAAGPNWLAMRFNG